MTFMIFEEVLKHLYFPHPPPHKRWQCLSVLPQLSLLASAPVWAPVPANYGQTKMMLQNKKIMIIFCICMTQTYQFQATKFKDYYCNYSSVYIPAVFVLATVRVWFLGTSEEDSDVPFMISDEVVEHVRSAPVIRETSVVSSPMADWSGSGKPT